MSMRWDFPQVPERADDAPPSVWWCVVIFVVVQVAAIVILVLMPGSRQLELNGAFFARLLLLPLLVCGCLWALLFAGVEASRADVDWWNFLCRYMRAHWRCWAHQQLVVMKSVILSGEENLVGRMLDTGSAAPLNQGRRLALGDLESQSGGPRLSLIVQQLVGPCLDHLPKSGTQEVQVFVQTSCQSDLGEVRSALGALGITGLERWTISAGNPVQTAALLAQWMDANAMPDVCLLLAYQLHEGEEEAINSEAAVAFLFRSRTMLPNPAGKLAAEAHVFRPIVVSQGKVFEALTTLLAAEPVPLSRIKHLWMGGLDSMERLALLAAVKDCGLELVVHEVDLAIGKPGVATPLVLQALGVQMATHGQGVQLVAAPTANGMSLNLVSTHIPVIAQVSPKAYSRTLLYAPTIFVSCTAALGVGCSILMPGWTSWSGWLCIGAILLILPLLVWLTARRRRYVERDFYQTSDDSSSEAS